MKRKTHRISSEGEMEAVLKEFHRLSKTKVKKKVIHIRISSEALSKIVIHNVNKEFQTNAIGDPADFHVHFYIEEP